MLTNVSKALLGRQVRSAETAAVQRLEAAERRRAVERAARAAEAAAAVAAAEAAQRRAEASACSSAFLRGAPCGDPTIVPAHGCALLRVC